MICSNCGSDLKEGRKFCEECGETIEQTTTNASTASRKARSKTYSKSKTYLIMIPLVLILAAGTIIAAFLLGPLLQESVQNGSNIAKIESDMDGLYPLDTAIAFLTYVQQGHYTEAHALIWGDFPIYLYEIEEEYRGIFQSLNYSNVSEAIEGRQIAVTLTITAVDFAAVMDEVMAEAEAFYSIFPDATFEELMRQIDIMLMLGMTAADAPLTSNEITMHLEMIEGRWMILANNILADAVTGGMLSFAEAVEELN